MESLYLLLLCHRKEYAAIQHLQPHYLASESEPQLLISGDRAGQLLRLSPC